MSEGEHLRGKSDEDLAIETFVDEIEEMHPNIDREELRQAVSGYVQDAVQAANSGEDEEDDDEDGDQ